MRAWPLVLLIALVPMGARADDPRAARAHFHEGTKAFDLGLYDLAIREYMAAYQAKSAPALLYNLAQAHRLAGHLKEAQRFYRIYLERLPNAKNRDEVEAKLAALAQQLEPHHMPPAKGAVQPGSPASVPSPPARSQRAREARSTTPPSAAERPLPNGGRAGAPPSAASGLVTPTATEQVPLRPTAEVPLPIALTTREPSPEAQRARRRRILGLGIGGVGVAAVATGIAFGVLAQQAGDSLSRASDMAGVYDPARYDRGRSYQIAEGVLIGVGLAGVVAAVTLYVVGRRTAPQKGALAWGR